MHLYIIACYIREYEKKIRAIKNNYSYQIIEESIKLSSQLIESDINSQILIILVYIVQVKIFVMILILSSIIWN